MKRICSFKGLVPLRDWFFERIGSLKGLVLKRIGLLKEKEYENERILQNMLAFVGSLNNMVS
ncbi:MAG: hypothetical protein SOX60_03960 [Prevotella sp.]|nr:hypothetical protein [Prevotella sp.]